MLRIRDKFPFRIPDPNCLHPGSRIRIKEFKYFNPKKTKKGFLSSRKYDLGCSFRIPDPDVGFLPIPDPGVKKAPDPGSATLRYPGSGKNSSRIQGSKRHRIPDPHSANVTEDSFHNVLYKCVLKFNFASISRSGLLIFSKKVKIIVLLFGIFVKRHYVYVHIEKKYFEPKEDFSRFNLGGEQKILKF